jgi:hypothetical protein
MTNEWTSPKGFIANSVGVVGGSMVGGITCLLVAMVVAAARRRGRVADRPSAPSMVQRERACSSYGGTSAVPVLAAMGSPAMSALLVVTATAVYIGLRNIQILPAFYLFLLPIVFGRSSCSARDAASPPPSSA